MLTKNCKIKEHVMIIEKPNGEQVIREILEYSEMQEHDGRKGYYTIALVGGLYVTLADAKDFFTYNMRYKIVEIDSSGDFK